MSPIANKWAGADLGPLQFESTFSYLLRFAWRNVINQHVLNEWFGTGYQKFVFDKERFGKQTGWSTSSNAKAGWELTPGGIQDIWLTQRLRYCPLCLEHCYHSFLFQCPSITCCPYHGIELSDRCQCCGLQNAKYALSSLLFRHPYRCPGCWLPIAGAMPNLEGHLQFRDDLQRRQRAFFPYVLWWEFVIRSKQRVRALLSDRVVEHQAKWCSTSDFLRGIVCKDIYTPQYVSPSNYPNAELVTLGWKSRISLDPKRDIVPFKTNAVMRTRIPQAVYRCTLRMLSRWIARSEGWTDAGFVEALAEERGENVSDYPPSLLAFMFLRWQLEDRFSEFPNFRFWPMHVAQLKDAPSMSMEDYQGRTPRLGWRAIFIAIYASWRERVLAGQGRVLRDLCNESKVDSSYIFARNGVRCRRDGQWWFCPILDPDEAWFEGEVAFLRIPGMPMLPWR